MENTHLETTFDAMAPFPDIERIASPMIGFPSILIPGSTLSIDIRAEKGLPVVNSCWQVYISRGVRRIKIENETTTDDGTYYYQTVSLPVAQVSYSKNYKYRLAVQIPTDLQVDLYDLSVEVNRKLFTQENAVQLIQAFPSRPKFCIITDLHVGFEGYPRIHVPNIDEISLFAKGIEELNSIRPDFIIIGGDLVDWSCPENWKDLRNLLKLLQVPSFTIIGNHDYYWDNWWVGYPPLLPPPVRSDPLSLRHYLKHINPHRRYSFDYGPLHAVCLDSGDDAILSAVEAFGSGLSDDDLQWLENDLQGREHSFIFMHHPVTRAGAEDELRRRANTGCITKNRVKFMNLCSKYRVKAVFSGHEHIDEYWYEGGVHYHTTPSIARSREHNGYRIIKLTENGGYDTKLVIHGIEGLQQRYLSGQGYTS